jgi:hypothetical protein
MRGPLKPAAVPAIEKRQEGSERGQPGPLKHAREPSESEIATVPLSGQRGQPEYGGSNPPPVSFLPG